MDIQFICPDCGGEHLEPADARLGHLVVCLDCAAAAENTAYRIRLTTSEPSLAA
jgi:hypothetical protein